MIFSKTKNKITAAALCFLFCFQGITGAFAQYASGELLSVVPYWSDTKKENTLILGAESDYLGSVNNPSLSATYVLEKTQQLANRIESEVLKIAKGSNNKNEALKELSKEIYNEDFDPKKTISSDNIMGVINAIEIIVYDHWIIKPDPLIDPLVNPDYKMQLFNAYEYYVAQAKSSLMHMEANGFTIFKLSANTIGFKARLKAIIGGASEDGFKPLVADPLVTPKDNKPVLLIPEFTKIGRDLQVLLTNKKSPITGMNYLDWSWDNSIPIEEMSVGLVDLAAEFKNVAGVRYKAILQKYATKKQAQFDYASKLHKEVSDIAGTISSSPIDMLTIMNTFKDKIDAIGLLADLPFDLPYDPLLLPIEKQEKGFNGFGSSIDQKGIVIEPLGIYPDHKLKDDLITDLQEVNYTDTLVKVDEYKKAYEIYPNLSSTNTAGPAKATWTAWQEARNAISKERDVILSKIVELMNRANMYLSEVKGKVDKLDTTLQTEQVTQTGLTTMWTDINKTVSSLVSWAMGIFSRSLNIGIEQISKNSYLKAIHAFMRDLANAFFVLLIVIFGLMTAFEVNSKKYSLQNLYPRFLQSVIMVNFSILFCQIITDFSLILTNVILEQAGEISTIGSAFSTTGTNVFGISGAAPALLFGNILTSPQAQILGGVFDNPLASIVILGLIFIVTMAVNIFLIIRSAAVWLLVALSPIIFLLWFIPELASFVKMWWSNLLRFVFMGPVVALVFLVGVSLSQISLSDAFLKIVIGLATFGLILAVPSFITTMTEHVQKLGDSVSPVLQNYLATLTRAVRNTGEKGGSERANTGIQQENEAASDAARLQLVQPNTTEIDLKKVWEKTQEKVKERETQAEVTTEKVDDGTERQPLQRLVELFKRNRPNTSSDTQRENEERATILEQKPLVVESTGRIADVVMPTIQVPEDEHIRVAVSPSFANEDIITPIPIQHLATAIQEETSPVMNTENLIHLSNLSVPELGQLFAISSPTVKNKILSSIDYINEDNTPVLAKEKQDALENLASEDSLSHIKPLGPEVLVAGEIDHHYSANDMQEYAEGEGSIPLTALTHIILEKTPLQDVPLDDLRQVFSSGDKDVKNFLLSTLNSPVQQEIWTGEQVGLLTKMAGEERIREAKEAMKEQAVANVTQNISLDEVPVRELHNMVRMMDDDERATVLQGIDSMTANGTPLFTEPQRRAIIDAMGESVINSLPDAKKSVSEVMAHLPVPTTKQLGRLVPELSGLTAPRQQALLALTHRNDGEGNPIFSPQEQATLVGFAGKTYADSLAHTVLPLPSAPIWDTLLQQKAVALEGDSLRDSFFQEGADQDRIILRGLAQQNNDAFMKPATREAVRALAQEYDIKSAEATIAAMVATPVPADIPSYTNEAFRNIAKGEAALSPEQLVQTIARGERLSEVALGDLQSIVTKASVEERELLRGAALSPIFTPQQKETLLGTIEERTLVEAGEQTATYLDAAGTARSILQEGGISQSSAQQLGASLESPFTKQSTMTALQEPGVLSAIKESKLSPGSGEGDQGKEFDIVSAVMHVLEGNLKANPHNRSAQTLTQAMTGDATSNEIQGASKPSDDIGSAATNEAIAGQAIQVGSGEGNKTVQDLAEERRDNLTPDTPYEQKVNKASFLGKNFITQVLKKRMIMK